MFSESSNVTIIQVATGKTHVMALDSKGNVWTWGSNDRGQLGNHTAQHAGMNLKKKDCDIPHLVPNLREIVQIYTGEYSSFTVDQSGDIRAWGLNKNN